MKLYPFVLLLMLVLMTVFRAAAQKDGCKTGSECLKLSLPLTREAFLFSRPSSYFLRYPV